MEETPEQYAKRVLEIILKSKDLTLDSPIFPENQATVKAEAEKDPINELLKEYGQPTVPITKAEAQQGNPIDKLLEEYGVPKPKDKPKKNPIDEMVEKANKGEPIEP